MPTTRHFLRLAGVAVIAIAAGLPGRAAAWTLGGFVDACNSGDQSRRNDCFVYMMGVIEGARAEWMSPKTKSDAAFCERVLFPVAPNINAEDQLVDVGKAVLKITKSVREQVKGQTDGDFAAKVLLAALRAHCETVGELSKPNQK